MKQPRRPRKPQTAKKAKDVREPKGLRKAKETNKSRVARRPDAAPGHSARERRTRQLVEVGTRGASFVFTSYR